MQLKRLGSVLFGLGLAIASTAAVAGANSVDSTLTRLYPEVSEATSEGTPVYGYKLDVISTGPNTQNKVSYTIQIFDGTSDDPAKAGFAFADDPNGTFKQFCKATVGATTITCNFGQMKAGRVIAPFFVYFSSPNVATTGAATSVRIHGLARFAEQQDGAGEPNSTTEAIYVDATAPTVPNPAAQFVAIGTDDTTVTEITTGLSRLQTKVTIGTTANDPTNIADLVKTTLSLPTVPLVPKTGTDPVLFTALNIFESRADVDTAGANNCKNGAGFKQCYQVQLDIEFLLFSTTTYDAAAELLRAVYYFQPSSIDAQRFTDRLLKVDYQETPESPVKTLGMCTTGGELPCIEYKQFFANNGDLKKAPAELKGKVEINSLVVITKSRKNGITRFF